MSDSAKERELADVELCYKAMGLSFSDPPDQVERVYKKLKEEHNKAMRSTNPSERQTAAEGLKQLEELFQTITNSLIYKDYAREYEKYKQIKEAQRIEKLEQQRLKQQEAKKIPMINCPTCGKPVASNLKVCIYCHRKILTPTEMMLEKLFSKRNMIILAVVLVLVAAGVVLSLNPELLRK